MFFADKIFDPGRRKVSPSRKPKTRTSELCKLNLCPFNRFSFSDFLFIKYLGTAYVCVLLECRGPLGEKNSREKRHRILVNMLLGYGTQINRNEAGDDDDIIKGANKKFRFEICWSSRLDGSPWTESTARRLSSIKMQIRFWQAFMLDDESARAIRDDNWQFIIILIHGIKLFNLRSQW